MYEELNLDELELQKIKILKRLFITKPCFNYYYDYLELNIPYGLGLFITTSNTISKRYSIEWSVKQIDFENEFYIKKLLEITKNYSNPYLMKLLKKCQMLENEK